MLHACERGGKANMKYEIRFDFVLFLTFYAVFVSK